VVRTEPSAPPSAEGELAAQWVGRVIDGRYKIVEVLGEGGMGAVFVAEHLKLRKLVALKTIRREFSGDGQAEVRFAREVRATAQIEHQHVVSALDCGHLPDGGAFLVIQLVRGRSLAKHLQRGPLHWRQVAELGAQIADALATCHAAGVIHRDLKPDNILLESRDDGSFHARIVDFGIARLSDEAGGADDAQPLTRMGSVIGTPGYMAPEQAVGQAIDHRVDLYALGVILWESCTGRQLWEGESLTELFARQLAGHAPSLLAAPPAQVPDTLAALTAQLLAPLAAERPASAVVVRDELRRIAIGDGALGTGTDARGVSGLHGPFPPASSLSAAPAPHTSGMRPTVPPVTPTGTMVTGAPALPLRVRALASQYPRGLRLGAAAAGLLFFVLLARCACGDAPPESEPAPSPSEHVGKSKGRKKDPQPEPPAEAQPDPAVLAAIDEVPAAYADAVKTLMSSSVAKARKRAAESITSASDEDKAKIPEYVRNLAWIEKTRRCEDKRKILLKIEESGEARALPGLQMLAKTSKNSCGSWMFTRDCLECMREDLGRMIGRFEAQQ
jgi:serine/threonine protein kinase